MKTKYFNPKLFVIIMIIAVPLLVSFNKQYAFNGEPYVKEKIEIKINGYEYTDKDHETYFTIRVGDATSSYIIYGEEFKDALREGKLNIGDYIKITDDCLIDEEGRITYFKASNEDIFKKFADKYEIQ